MPKENKKIRVLQVMDKCAIRGSPIHGVSRLLLTWWPGFEDTHIEFELAVLRGGHGTCNAFNIIGIDVIDLGRSKVDPRTIIDLVKLVKKKNIDVLHCHGYGSTTFGRIAGLIARCPVVVHEHMVDKDIPIYQEMVDRMLRSLTSKGIAVSKAVEKFMIEKRYIKSSTMQVVYNTIPPHYCKPIPETDVLAVRKKYNIPNDKKLIGIIGRLDIVKGHKYFLESAKLILEIKTDVLFLIIGDGEIREDLECLSNTLRIDAHVKFLGHCDDVLEITSILDIFISSSLSEGLPMAHTEAMAQGKTIVATAVGGVPELLTHEKTALLVESKNATALAEATIKLLDDTNLAQSLGVAAKIECEQNFTTPKSVRELSDIYESLVK